jgi:integrase
MKRAPTLVALANDYLRARRQMGFALRIEGRQLLNFARFADRTGHRGPITIDLVVRWARSSACDRQITCARRIEVLRPFAKYRQQFDAATEIPPPRLLGPGHRRLVPHIYSETEIVSLLDAALNLKPVNGLRPLTYRTLFGLVAATGLRISEARELARSEVDLGHAVLMVGETKFRKSRWVPLHASTVRALQRYAQARDQKVRNVGTEAFFVSDRGQALDKRTVNYTFEKLRTQIGCVARGGYAAPRIYDLRHTFICRALLRFYREGRQIDKEISALSTYVGHAKVTDTYWYITGIPELMAMAAQRFERFARGASR